MANNISIKIIQNKDYGYANLSFSGVPNNDMLKEMKENGWAYSKYNNLWYPRTSEAKEKCQIFAYRFVVKHDPKEAERISEEQTKQYSQELREHVTAEANNKKDSVSYMNSIINKIQAAGIEVISDKDEFDRILEQEELLQKMVTSLSEEEQKRYFTFNEEDAKHFVEQIKDWENDSANPGKLIIVGNIPPVMKVLGFADNLIEVEQSTLNKMVRDYPLYPTDEQGHEMTMKSIYSIPSELANPVMVFKSKTRTDSYVFFTERKDNENHSILIPMAVNKRLSRIVINEITSMYGKENEINFVNENYLEDKLIYLDKERSIKWAQNWLEKEKSSNGERYTKVQFLGQRFTDIETYNPIILTKEKLVNFISADSRIVGTQKMATHENTYGFVYNNKIYLNPDLMNSNAAVHEYTHLWDLYTQKTNPKLWDKGLELFKGTKYWNEVITDPNYQDIKDDENLVLSEIHARIQGDIAEQVLNRIAELDGEKTKLEAIDWDKEVIEYIAFELDFKVSREDAKAITDFLSMPIKDLMSSKNIIVDAPVIDNANNNLQVDEYQDYGNFTDIDKEEIVDRYLDWSQTNVLSYGQYIKEVELGSDVIDLCYYDNDGVKGYFLMLNGKEITADENILNTRIFGSEHDIKLYLYNKYEQFFADKESERALDQAEAMADNISYVDELSEGEPLTAKELAVYYNSHKQNNENTLSEELAQIYLDCFETSEFYVYVENDVMYRYDHQLGSEQDKERYSPYDLFNFVEESYQDFIDEETADPVRKQNLKNILRKMSEFSVGDISDNDFSQLAWKDTVTGKYIVIQTSDEEIFDYTIYDSEFNDIDGGVGEDIGSNADSLSLIEAAKIIMINNNIDFSNCVEADYDLIVSIADDLQIKKAYSEKKAYETIVNNFERNQEYHNSGAEQYDDEILSKEMNSNKAFGETISLNGIEYEKSEVENDIQDIILSVFNDNNIESPLIEAVKIYKPEDYNLDADNNIHVLLQFKNLESSVYKWNEDGLFNVLHDSSSDEEITFDGIFIDVNPIDSERTGTIEEYLENLRINARNEIGIINVLPNNTDYISKWSEKKDSVERGSFILKDNSNGVEKYISIDNRDGNAWTEEFDSLKKAVIYSLGQSSVEEVTDMTIEQQNEEIRKLYWNDADLALLNENLDKANESVEVTLLRDSLLTSSIISKIQNNWILQHETENTETNSVDTSNDFIRIGLTTNDTVDQAVEKIINFETRNNIIVNINEARNHAERYFNLSNISIESVPDYLNRQLNSRNTKEPLTAEKYAELFNNAITSNAVINMDTQAAQAVLDSCANDFGLYIENDFIKSSNGTYTVNSNINPMELLRASIIGRGEKSPTNIDPKVTLIFDSVGMTGGFAAKERIVKQYFMDMFEFYKNGAETEEEIQFLNTVNNTENWFNIDTGNKLRIAETLLKYNEVHHNEHFERNSFAIEMEKNGRFYFDKELIKEVLKSKRNEIRIEEEKNIYFTEEESNILVKLGFERLEANRYVKNVGYDSVYISVSSTTYNSNLRGYSLYQKQDISDYDKHDFPSLTSALLSIVQDNPNYKTDLKRHKLTAVFLEPKDLIPYLDENTKDFYSKSKSNNDFPIEMKKAITEYVNSLKQSKYSSNELSVEELQKILQPNNFTADVSDFMRDYEIRRTENPLETEKESKIMTAWEYLYDIVDWDRLEETSEELDGDPQRHSQLMEIRASILDKLCVNIVENKYENLNDIMANFNIIRDSEIEGLNLMEDRFTSFEETKEYLTKEIEEHRAVYTPVYEKELDDYSSTKENYGDDLNSLQLRLHHEQTNIDYIKYPLLNQIDDYADMWKGVDKQYVKESWDKMIEEETRTQILISRIADIENHIGNNRSSTLFEQITNTNQEKSVFDIVTDRYDSEYKDFFEQFEKAKQANLENESRYVGNARIRESYEHALDEMVKVTKLELDDLLSESLTREEAIGNGFKFVNSLSPDISSRLYMTSYYEGSRLGYYDKGNFKSPKADILQDYFDKSRTYLKSFGLDSDEIFKIDSVLNRNNYAVTNKQLLNYINVYEEAYNKNNSADIKKIKKIEYFLEQINYHNEIKELQNGNFESLRDKYPVISFGVIPILGEYEDNTPELFDSMEDAVNEMFSRNAELIQNGEEPLYGLSMKYDNGRYSNGEYIPVYIPFGKEIDDSLRSLHFDTTIIEADSHFRNEVSKQTFEKLHQLLSETYKNIDPIDFDKIEKNDLRRSLKYPGFLGFEDAYNSWLDKENPRILFIYRNDVIKSKYLNDKDLAEAQIFFNESEKLDLMRPKAKAARIEREKSRLVLESDVSTLKQAVEEDRVDEYLDKLIAIVDDRIEEIDRKESTIDEENNLEESSTNTPETEKSSEISSIELTSDDMAKAKMIIPSEEWKTVLSYATEGEEQEHFKSIIKRTADSVRDLQKMRKENINQDGSHPCIFHYYLGNSDWYISELDKDGIGFGYCILNDDLYNSEWGSVNVCYEENGDALSRLTINAPIIINGREFSREISPELDLYLNEGTTIERELYKRNPDFFAEYKRFAEKKEDLTINNIDESPKVSTNIIEENDHILEVENVSKRDFGLEGTNSDTNRSDSDQELEGRGQDDEGGSNTSGRYSIQQSDDKGSLQMGNSRGHDEADVQRYEPEISVLSEQGRFSETPVYQNSERSVSDGSVDLSKRELGNQSIQHRSSSEQYRDGSELSKKEKVEIRQQIKSLLEQKSDKDFTPDDINLLRLYEGGGGLKEQDVSSAATLNEFYTPSTLVQKVWSIVDAYSPNALTVLEPSSGIGRFADGRDHNVFTLRELDETSARIAKILHPNANVIQGAFQSQYFDEEGIYYNKNYQLPKFDVVIGNPPYGENKNEWSGKGEGKEFRRAEEYFIDRGLQSLKDKESVLAFVVPSGFLETSNDNNKKLIASHGTLIDAYRLPVGTFPTTEVATDIIVMRSRKYSFIEEYGEYWDDLTEEQRNTLIDKEAAKLSDNAWFNDNPDKILGKSEDFTNQWGEHKVRTVCHEGLSVEQELNKIDTFVEKINRKSEINTDFVNWNNVGNGRDTDYTYLLGNSIERYFAGVNRNDENTYTVSVNGEHLEQRNPFTNELEPLYFTESELDRYILDNTIYYGESLPDREEHKQNQATTLDINTLSDNGKFVFEKSSNGMLSKYIEQSDINMIDDFRIYAAAHISGEANDGTYYAQMWKLGAEWCINNHLPVPSKEQHIYDDFSLVENVQNNPNWKVFIKSEQNPTEEAAKNSPIVLNARDEDDLRNLISEYVDRWSLKNAEVIGYEKIVYESENIHNQDIDDVVNNEKPISEISAEEKREANRLRSQIEKEENLTLEYNKDNNIMRIIRNDVVIGNLSRNSKGQIEVVTSSNFYEDYRSAKIKMQKLYIAFEKENNSESYSNNENNIEKSYVEKAFEEINSQHSISPIMNEYYKLKELNEIDFNNISKREWRYLHENYATIIGYDVQTGEAVLWSHYSSNHFAIAKADRNGVVTTLYNESTPGFISLSKANVDNINSVISNFKNSIRELNDRFIGCQNGQIYIKDNSIYSSSLSNIEFYDSKTNRVIQINNNVNVSAIGTLYNRNEQLNTDVSYYDYNNPTRYSNSVFYASFNTLYPKEGSVSLSKVLEENSLINLDAEESFNMDNLNETEYNRMVEFKKQRMLSISDISSDQEWCSKTSEYYLEKRQKRNLEMQLKHLEAKKEQDSNEIFSAILNNSFDIKDEQHVFVAIGSEIVYKKLKDKSIDVYIDDEKAFNIDVSKKHLKTFNNYYVTPYFVGSLNNQFEKQLTVSDEAYIAEKKLSLDEIIRQQKVSKSRTVLGSNIAHAFINNLQSGIESSETEIDGHNIIIKQDLNNTSVFIDNTNYKAFDFDKKNNVLKFYQPSFDEGLILSIENSFLQHFTNISVTKDITVDNTHYIDTDGKTIVAPNKEERYYPKKEHILSTNEFAEIYGTSWNSDEKIFWQVTDWKGYVDTSKLSEEQFTALKQSDNYFEETKNKYIHRELFASGNIYEKLEKNEERFNNGELSNKSYYRNKEALTKALPKAYKIDEINLSIRSPFIQNLDLDGIPVSEKFLQWATGYNNSENENSRSSIVDYSQASINRDDIPENISWSDIVEYIDGVEMAAIRNVESDEERNQIRNQKLNNRKQTAEMLFNRYMKVGMTKEEQEYLLDKYNRTFNYNKKPDYSKLPLYVEGMNEYCNGNPFKLYEQQIKGVAALSNKGNGLLAYEVGVGKTAAGIVATVNQIQTSRAKRPLIVVPKSVMASWEHNINELFPDVPLIVLGNMGKKSIEKYYDGNHGLNIPSGAITLVSKEALNNISFKKTTIDNDLWEDYIDLLSKHDQINSDNPRERAKAKEEIYQYAGVASAIKDPDYILWENTGFDHITVDEAHAYKNLYKVPRPKKGGVNEFGMMGQGKPSKRALKMFNITQLIQKQNEDRNVFMLTATPFTNSPLEVYSMLTYIARKELEQQGIKDLHSFCQQYADADYELSVTHKNTVEYKQVVKGFNDVRSLQNTLLQFIDKVGAEEALVIRPDKKTHAAYLEPTSLQLEIFDFAQNNLMEYKPEKGEKRAPVLEGLNIMEQASISPALLKEDLLVDPESHEPIGIPIPPIEEVVECSPKLKATCDSIIKTWKEHKDCGQIIYMNKGVEAFPHIIKYMEKQGIPKEVFASIDGQDCVMGGTKLKGDKDYARETIAQSFNDKNNPCKILIGSSAISEGMNLNGNTIALYNLTLGWNPTEVVQVEGRAWRQGNEQGHVHIVYPLLENSCDPFLYQKHYEKMSRIDDLFSYTGSKMQIDSVDADEARWSLIKDPTKRAKLELSEEKARLDKEKLTYENQLQDYDSLIKSRVKFKEKLSNRIQQKEDYINNYQQSLFENNPSREPEEQKKGIERFDKSISEINKQLENIKHKFKEMGIESEDDEHNFAIKVIEKKNEIVEKIDKLFDPDNQKIIIAKYKKQIEEENLQKKERALINPIYKDILNDMVPFSVVEARVQKERYDEAEKNKERDPEGFKKAKARYDEFLEKRNKQNKEFENIAKKNEVSLQQENELPVIPNEIYEKLDSAIIEKDYSKLEKMLVWGDRDIWDSYECNEKAVSLLQKHFTDKTHIQLPCTENTNYATKVATVAALASYSKKETVPEVYRFNSFNEALSYQAKSFGSYEGCKERLLKVFKEDYQKNGNVSSFVTALKNEYGEGGGGFLGYNYDHYNGKGIKIRAMINGVEQEKQFTWSEVAREKLKQLSKEYPMPKPERVEMTNTSPIPKLNKLEVQQDLFDFEEIRQDRVDLDLRKELEKAPLPSMCILNRDFVVKENKFIVPMVEANNDDYVVRCYGSDVSNLYRNDSIHDLSEVNIHLTLDELRNLTKAYISAELELKKMNMNDRGSTNSDIHIRKKTSLTDLQKLLMKDFDISEERQAEVFGELYNKVIYGGTEPIAISEEKKKEMEKQSYLAQTDEVEQVETTFDYDNIEQDDDWEVDM